MDNDHAIVENMSKLRAFWSARGSRRLSDPSHVASIAGHYSVVVKHSRDMSSVQQAVFSGEL